MVMLRQQERLSPTAWWAGAVGISATALLVLHRFFIDLVMSLQQQLPDVLADYESLSVIITGCAISIFVALCGFVAGSTSDDLDPKQTQKRLESGKPLKTSWPPTRKIAALLLGLGICIGFARYAKVLKGDRPLNRIRVPSEESEKLRRSSTKAQIPRTSTMWGRVDVGCRRNAGETKEQKRSRPPRNGGQQNSPS